MILYPKVVTYRMCVCVLVTLYIPAHACNYICGLIRLWCDGVRARYRSDNVRFKTFPMIMAIADTVHIVTCAFYFYPFCVCVCV